MTTPAGQPAPRNVHVCPDGRITQRAGVLALLVRTKFEPQDVVEVAEQIADDVSHMRKAGLCLRCGYPLDNSSPHPAAHPERRPA